MTSIRQFIGNIGLPDLNRAQGVDVYGKYQGYFRPELATQRIDFAIQKLTEGITIVDAKRDEIWAGVKQIGMRGAYHYQRSGVSWLAQANYFLDFASKYDHHFIALDVETLNNELNNSFASDLYRIINHWKDQVRTSKKVVLYSNKDLLTSFIFPKIQLLFGDAGVKWLVDEVDIWYAQYWTFPSVNKQPSLPSWMKTWKLWQITASAFKGSDFGVQSQEVDVNVFNGTADEMRAWLRLAPGTPDSPTEPPVIVIPPTRPEITPEPRMWDATVLAFRTMLVRTYPEVANDTILKKANDPTKNVNVQGGETFSGRIWSGNDYLWLRIETSLRAELMGRWVAVRRSDGLEKFITLLPSKDVPIPPTLPPTLPSDVYRVMKWGDPILVAEADRTVSTFPPEQSPSNFQAIGLYNKIAGGFGGVSHYLRIPPADIKRLASLQVEDNFIDKKPGWNIQYQMEAWRVQKMNWLIKERGTIYFFYHHRSSGHWSTLDYAEWGTIALGNTLVSVEDVEVFPVTTPDNKRRTRQMARLAGFRKSDWARSLNDLVENGLVHRCFCVYSGDDIGDSPKGIVYSPFWSPRDWTYISSTKPQPDAFYLPLDWLIKE
jgi:GH25 family lysozyme M1 (1,4-beta-N-acetylmuramidase)